MSNRLNTYSTLIAEQATHAAHILDRFLIMQEFGKMIDINLLAIQHSVRYYAASRCTVADGIFSRELADW